MDYKYTIEMISRNLEELEILISGFYSQKRIPHIELDLALAKLRDMYDVLLMIKQSGQESGSAKSPEENDPSVFAEKPESSPEAKKKPEQDTSPEAEQKKETGEKIINDTAEQPDSKKDTTVKKEKDPEILSDTFQDKTALLNENLGQSKYNKDYSSFWMTKPLTNLKDAIGLNDKFLFINELFRGDTEKYNQTIEVLNNASNFNEAYNYLMENFNWDMDNELVQNMLNLIRRKLIIHKNE